MKSIDKNRSKKLSQQALRLILITLGDPSVSQLTSEVEKFSKLWEESYEASIDEK